MLDTDSVVAEPGAKYILLTDVVPVDDCRYKFHTRSGHPLAPAAPVLPWTCLFTFNMFL